MSRHCSPSKKFRQGQLGQISQKRSIGFPTMVGHHPVREKETARKPTQARGAAGGEEDYVTGGKSSTHNTRLPYEPPESDE